MNRFLYPFMAVAISTSMLCACGVSPAPMSNPRPTETNGVTVLETARPTSKPPPSTPMAAASMPTLRVAPTQPAPAPSQPNSLASMRWMPQLSSKTVLIERDHKRFNKIIAGDSPDWMFFVPEEDKYGKLLRYNINTHEIVTTTFIGGHGLPSYPDNLIRTRDGQIWSLGDYYSAPQILRRYDRTQGVFKAVRDRDGILDRISPAGRKSMCESPNGKLYLVVNEVAYEYEPATGVARRVVLDSVTAKVSDRFPNVESVDCGTSALWLIVTAKKHESWALARLDWKDAHVSVYETPILPEREAPSEIVSWDDEVWLADWPRGLYRVDIVENRATWTQVRAADDSFYPTTLDRTRDGLLWMSTARNIESGLWVYDPHNGSWRDFPGLNSPIGELSDGSVWAATPDQIYKLDRGVK